MKNVRKERVVFGIDESFVSWVAASILRNQDHDLLAIHLYVDLPKLGLDPTLYPSALKKSDIESVEKFCKSLEVPLKVIDVTGEVLALVEDPAWVATLSGLKFPIHSAWTCDVLFPYLMDAAKSWGADFVATGHFARLIPDLVRHPETEFDQAARLASLPRSFLKRTRLPLGDVSIEMLLRLAIEVSPPGILPKTLAELPEDHSAFFREHCKKKGKWEWSEGQLTDPRVHARATPDFFKTAPFVALEEGAMLEEAPESIETGSLIHSAFLHHINWSNERKPSANGVRRFSAALEAASPCPALLFEYPDHLGEIQFEEPFYGLTVGERLIFFEGERVLGSALVASLVTASQNERGES